MVRLELQLIKKPIYLLAFSFLLIVLAFFGADFFYLVAIAIFPLLFERLNHELKIFRASDQAILKLPKLIRNVPLNFFRKTEPAQLSDSERIQLKKASRGLFYLVFFVLFLFAFRLIAAILQGEIPFFITSSSVFVLYLVFHLLFLTIIKYEKRLLEHELGSEHHLTRESGRLNYLSFIAYFNIVLILLSMLELLIGETQAQSIYLFQFQDTLIFLCTIFILTLNVEAFLKMIRDFSLLFSKEAKQLDTTWLVFLEIFFGKSDLRSSVYSFFKDLLGIDLKKSELCRFFISIFEPVFIFSLILAWLLSSIVIIGPDQSGIVYRFGKIESSDCNPPGLLFKLPWPLGNYLIEKKNELRMVNVGFEPDLKANYIIWTKPHSKENFNLLVGDGLEMLSIDCQIIYRLKNVKNYLLGYQNPEELLKALAYRFLTFETVSSTFDSIIARDRRLLADKLQKEIQQELDRRNCGMEIVKVVFLAMHPPIEIATSFEDVISAGIDKQTFEMYAQTESIHNRHMHTAFAQGEILSAQGNAVTAVADASGQAQAFVSQSIGFNASPELVKFRLKLKSLQKLVENKKLYVIDKSLLRPNDRLMLRVTE